MARRLQRKLAGYRIPTRVVRAPAEQLPFDAESFDDVVCTLVLCTVADPVRALSEVRRVLKPQGRLLLIEHVRSEDPRLAGWRIACADHGRGSDAAASATAPPSRASAPGGSRSPSCDEKCFRRCRRSCGHSSSGRRGRVDAGHGGGLRLAVLRHCGFAWAAITTALPRVGYAEPIAAKLRERRLLGGRQALAQAASATPAPAPRAYSSRPDGCGAPSFSTCTGNARPRRTRPPSLGGGAGGAGNAPCAVAPPAPRQPQRTPGRSALGASLVAAAALLACGDETAPGPAPRTRPPGATAADRRARRRPPRADDARREDRPDDPGRPRTPRVGVGHRDLRARVDPERRRLDARRRTRRRAGPT